MSECETWLFGDVPTVRNLPRMSQRQKEFAAQCPEATIEPTGGWFRRLLARAQLDEVETLRKMLKQVNR